MGKFFSAPADLIVRRSEEPTDDPRQHRKGENPGNFTMTDESVNQLRVILAKERTSYATGDYLNLMEIQDEDGGKGVSMDTKGKRPETSWPLTKKRKLHDLRKGNDIEEKVFRGTEANTEAHSSDVRKPLMRKSWREKMCEWAYQGKKRMQLGRLESP